ncbi:hypothetical protein BpHYR1_021912 [Brachionus plicatilis]|uniref:Uncharacterized protein n=1 Tax=Brachionus plicatilis TaxID=10195 RepID=A0A3M7PLD3_BRAPC|nr:hypothetical protein BpHYR1_021912 [Brachionus plicatilis]
MVFLIIYIFTCITSVGNGLGISYTLNNVILLIISAFPIAYLRSFQAYLTFAYACVISSCIDLLIISMTLALVQINTDQKLNYFAPIIFGSVFILIKFFISISEIQIARFLADEPELKLSFSIDIFNHTKYPIYSVCNINSENEKNTDDITSCFKKEPQSPAIRTVPVEI